MGVNTTNNYFYKPALGASGAIELALFDAALDATDLVIKDLVDNKQPLDAGLTSIAALTTAADKMIYTTALDTYAVASLTAFARSILDDADEATFKATVNLEIGTDILAQQTIGIADDNLVEIDHASVADNDYAKFTVNGLEGRSYSEVRTDLGLVISTNVQAYDAALTSISGLTYVSASFIKLTANDTYAVRTLAQTLTDIGGAASGANADITSMTGLSNDGIPLAKVANAASDGANSDITSLTGLTTPLGAAYGGTGVLNNALNTITFTGNYTLGLTLTANTAITLPTTGTLATTSLKLSAFAATTSAELAGVISDETGSGALVFGTSPTITTPSVVCHTTTLTDDTATSFTPTLVYGILFIYNRNLSGVDTTTEPIAIINYDASDPVGISSLFKTTNIELATGTLAGTTGADGKFTISVHTDGKIYLEHRLGGATRYIGYWYFGST